MPTKTKFITSTQVQRRSESLFDSFRTDDILAVITDALSGIAGGALLFSYFGIMATILGGVLGGLITGLSGYQNRLKKIANRNYSQNER